MSKQKRVILVIMDGWGHGTKPASSAIAQANTPFIDDLYTKYPHSELVTFGEEVGLPDGQMGNSEVGHLNIGAGRIVYQELLRINNSIKSGELNNNETLLNTFKYAKENNKPLHLMGLVSDGGVHSHIDHLKALCQYATDYGVNEIYIHAFTDGRDTDPKGGLDYIKELETSIENNNAEVASLIGRYYAMDRDKRWERIKLAYDLLTNGKGQQVDDISRGIEASYNEGVTDEFIKPIVKIKDGKPLTTISEGDAVLCFNFRTDRCRQITEALTQKNFDNFGMNTLDLHYATMTNYDAAFKGTHIIFENDDLKMTLGETLAKKGKTQIRAAETEKYPHVTFFFSGGRETPFDGEKRIMAASPKVATYDLQPEMSANELTEKILPELQNQTADFVCLNFANADMVGHTGDFDAAIKACETVNNCVEQIVNAALKSDYSILLTADHGNADYLVNEDGTPNTAHTKNMVPLFLIENENRFSIKNGKLGDLAPTILSLMGLNIPDEMSGEILTQ